MAELIISSASRLKMNKERVARAKAALRAWAPPDTDGFDVDCLETDILGLMVDLLHFAEQAKLDTKQLLGLAELNLNEESGR